VTYEVFYIENNKAATLSAATFEEAHEIAKEMKRKGFMNIIIYDAATYRVVVAY
jgi:hypothetical protein